MNIHVDLFGNEAPSRKPRWRCLPVPGSYPAAKVPLPVIPPPKHGFRRVALVDSFAGAGGATNGIEEALKRLKAANLLPVGHPLHVTYAINHDEPAIVTHEINHPRTIHLPHNVWQVSMRETLGDDIFGFLWLSPDCRDHSNAKGGPVTSRAVRDLAWVLVKWLKELPDWQRPWVICLENVGAFGKWSPLIERKDGRGFERDPDRIGWTFHQFIHEVCSYGYSAGWEEMVACEYGSPTIRKRLKLCFRRDAQPIVIPEPTHGDPKSDAVKQGRLQPWPVAADIIDFGIDCPSIFLTREEAREYTKRTGKRIIRPLAVKTDARLATGVKRHVIDAGDEAFVVTCNHGGDGFRGQPLGEPFNTVASSRDAHGLVVPQLSPLPATDDLWDRLPPAWRRAALKGTDAQTIAPFIAIFRGDSAGRPATEPLPTATANSFIKRPGGASPIGVVVPHLMTMRNSGKPTSAADQPTHTVMAGGANQFDVETLLAPIISRGQHGGGNRAAGQPFHTIAASDGDQNQVAAVYLAQHNTGEEGHDVRRPVSTIVQKGCTQGVVAAHMLSLHGNDRRDGRCTDPHVAVCAGGNHSAVVQAAFIKRDFGNSIGQSTARPLGAITSGGGGKAELITLPLMTAYYSTGGQHARVDDPMLTVPTKARFGLTHVDAAVPPLTDAQWARARQVAEFLRRHGCWDGGEVVTLSIRGVWYVIVDIGMRMLTPRELARAQSFPETYILDPIYKGKPLSETEQRHKIGNSVCKEPAAAFVEANYRPPLEWGEQNVPFLEAAE